LNTNGSSPAIIACLSSHCETCGSSLLELTDWLLLTTPATELEAAPSELALLISEDSSEEYVLLISDAMLSVGFVVEVAPHATKLIHKIVLRNITMLFRTIFSTCSFIIFLYISFSATIQTVLFYFPPFLYKSLVWSTYTM
jgi:hypothetical protein